MRRFFEKIESFLPGSPEAKALEEVRQSSSDGLLHPQNVVEAARSSDSPLHSHFTWDNAEAAESYRLQEARMLIRRFVIVIPKGEPLTLRAWIRAAPAPGYVPMQKAAKSPQLLDAAARREIGSCLSAIESINAGGVLNRYVSVLEQLLGGNDIKETA